MNRRRFLQRTALTVTALSVLPTLAFGKQESIHEFLAKAKIQLKGNILYDPNCNIRLGAKDSIEIIDGKLWCRNVVLRPDNFSIEKGVIYCENLYWTKPGAEKTYKYL